MSNISKSDATQCRVTHVDVFYVAKYGRIFELLRFALCKIAIARCCLAEFNKVQCNVEDDMEQHCILFRDAVQKNKMQC